MQRQTGSTATQSFFRPGTYQVQNVRRNDNLKGGKRQDFKYGSDYTTMRINSRAEYDAIAGQQIQMRERNRARVNGKRWQDTGQTTTRDDRDFRRIGGGSTWENREAPVAQGRVAIKDETAGRIKSRPARAAQKNEVNYRSQRKRKGTGLRIGGSGVNVPGGGGGVSI